MNVSRLDNFHDHSLRSKRFQSSYCAKVSAEAKKRFLRSPPPPPSVMFFLLLSQLSRRTSQGNACYAGYHDHYRWASRNHNKTKLKRFRITAITATGWGQEEGPRGVLGISSDEDDRMGPKVKTPKNPSIIPVT